MADLAPGPGQPTARSPSARQRRWVLLSVAFGAFLAPLDSSIVHTVLPLIARDLGADVLRIQWVVLASLLTMCSLLLVGGRLGDLFGDRRLYIGGFALFTLSAVLAGMARAVEPLIAARVLQAAGGAMLIANGPAILTRAFPAAQRGRVLGIQASVVYFGLTIGPGLGGLIASTLGWRWVFFVNLPIGIAAMTLASLVLPPAQRAPRPARLDAVGPALFIATVFSLVLAISRGGAWGWTSREVLLAGSLSGVSLALFVRAEVRDAAPFFDLRLFRNRLFSAATASALMNYMASSTTAFLTPFLLIRGMGLPANRAGMVLMATPFVMAVVAPVSGRLSDRIGSRLLTVSGMACLALGMGLLSRVGPESTQHAVLLRLALVGVGVGLFTSPNNNAIMGAVPQGEQGLASGLVATARSLGMVLGVSVSGALFGGEVQRLLAGGAAEPAAVLTAYRHALAVGAGIALLGALTSLVRGEFTKR